MSNKNIKLKAVEKPEFRNINALMDLPTYRLPMAGIVSITHRITGVVLFFSMPFWVWLFSLTVGSQQEFNQFKGFFSEGFLFLPWPIVKLGALILMFCCFHYIWAGLRHVYLEITHNTTKDFGRRSAIATFICSISCTLIFAVYLFIF